MQDYAAKSSPDMRVAGGRSVGSLQAKRISPEVPAPTTRCHPGLSVDLDSATLSRLTSLGPSSASPFLLQLQRRYGNRYVQRVVALASGETGEQQVAPEVESTIERKRGGGHGLASGLRTEMESVFGTDFSGVRVHTDAEANALNRAVNAVAFTTGQDIFFGHGAYNPDSSPGRELLAHELTHVVQQGGDSRIQGKLVSGEPGDVYEREADAVARQVVSAPFGSLHRKCACGGETVSGGECESCRKRSETAVQARFLQRAPGSTTDGTGSVAGQPGCCDAEQKNLQNKQDDLDKANSDLEAAKKKAEAAGTVGAAVCLAGLAAGGLPGVLSCTAGGAGTLYFLIDLENANNKYGVAANALSRAKESLTACAAKCAQPGSAPPEVNVEDLPKAIPDVNVEDLPQAP